MSTTIKLHQDISGRSIGVCSKGNRAHFTYVRRDGALRAACNRRLPVTEQRTSIDLAANGVTGCATCGVEIAEIATEQPNPTPQAVISDAIERAAQLGLDKPYDIATAITAALKAAGYKLNRSRR